MITTTTPYKELMEEQAKSAYGFALVQLPTEDGANVAAQVMLPNIISYRMKKSQDASSNTCDLTFADDTASMFSPNPGSKLGLLFAPGRIDTKFLMYLGFRGGTGSGTSNFILNNQASLLQFTGFAQTDSVAQQPLLMDKSVSLIDLTSQFKFQVNDTFPHPVYGNQTLSYFDPTYNLTSTDGINWTGMGKMFTLDNTSKVYGSTHIDPAVFVDTTGGQAPSSTAVPNTGWTLNTTTAVGTCTNYSFDYKNGAVTFTAAGLAALGYPSALPTTSIVSVAGNPTYMAPEDIIYKLFVEFGSWDKNFLNLQTSNILLPQFSADGKTLWDCAKVIASMTNPRFVNWNLWCDENGVIHFGEENLDSPTVKEYIKGKGLLNATYENTSRQLRTVVRGDGETYDANGDTQTVTAIAYDVRAVNRYGLTEPLSLSSDVTAGVRHLGPTDAVSQLTMLCASALRQVSRPILTVTAEVWPDYSLQIGDKVWLYDDSLGMDREFGVTGITNEGDLTTAKQTLTLTEFFETVNFSLGISSAVVAGDQFQASAVSPPSNNLIGAVRLGSNNGTYIYQNSDVVVDKTTGDPIEAFWATSDGTPMHFDLYLNPFGNAASTTPATSWTYTNLPTGYAWQSQVYAPTGDTVYYGTVPASPLYGGTPGYTVYVGPDGVFYQFNHAPPIVPSDLNSIWIPTGNTTPPSAGGSPGYTGTGSNAYVWSWWYLCLDSTLGSGPSNRPIMRVNPAIEGVAQAVSATSGLWLTNSWALPPGPVYNTGTYASLGALDSALFTGTGAPTKLYGNVALNVTNYTIPPAGFIGANIMSDGTDVGVAWGGDAVNTALYVNYKKKNRGHFCVFVCNDAGARQFLRVPFQLLM